MLERGGGGAGSSRQVLGALCLIWRSGLDLGSQTRISNWEVTGWDAFMIASAGRKENVPTFWTKI